VFGSILETETGVDAGFLYRITKTLCEKRGEALIAITPQMKDLTLENVRLTLLLSLLSVPHATLVKGEIPRSLL